MYIYIYIYRERVPQVAMKVYKQLRHHHLHHEISNNTSQTLCISTTPIQSLLDNPSSHLKCPQRRISVVGPVTPSAASQTILNRCLGSPSASLCLPIHHRTPFKSSNSSLWNLMIPPHSNLTSHSNKTTTVWAV